MFENADEIYWSKLNRCILYWMGYQTEIPGQCEKSKLARNNS
ncbi:MAG: hypothetical protein OEY00_10215 [Gammaproteobacteria bacterium]|nr:hypothetical protein [Gammaproteobacteria bacterium]